MKMKLMRIIKLIIIQMSNFKFIKMILILMMLIKIATIMLFCLINDFFLLIKLHFKYNLFKNEVILIDILK